MEKTMELRRKSEAFTATTLTTAAKQIDDQGFTLVSNQRPAFFKRGSGRPHKQVQDPVPTPQQFASSRSDSRPQPSLFGTREQGKDGEVYYG